MDVLSDILQAVRLKSNVYFRSSFSSPWGLEMPDGNFAQFHLVVSGECWLKVNASPDLIKLATGDIVVLIHGNGHWLAGNPDHPRIPAKKFLQAKLAGNPMFQSGSPDVTLVCGHFEFDRSFPHPFIESLPDVILLRETKRDQLQWMEAVTKVLIQEAVYKEPGSAITTTRLAEVLFIQIIRSYIDSNNISTGYLAALQDQNVSQALQLIHNQFKSNWTLEAIARRIGMSRSAFSARFKHLTALSPMEYLTRWRMNKAKEILINRDLNLLEVAEAVGYSSEPAFSRAFKRQFNVNPGSLRKNWMSNRN